MKDIPVLKVDRFFKQEEIFIFLSLAVNISKFGIWYIWWRFAWKRRRIGWSGSHLEHHPLGSLLHFRRLVLSCWFHTCSHPYHLRSHTPDWAQWLQIYSTLSNCNSSRLQRNRMFPIHSKQVNLNQAAIQAITKY